MAEPHNKLRRKQTMMVSEEESCKILKGNFTPAWLDKMQNLFGMSQDITETCKLHEKLIA
eukprot:847701-Heterocapsa_arctica.AAC.1